MLHPDHAPFPPTMDYDAEALLFVGSQRCSQPKVERTPFFLSMVPTHVLEEGHPPPPPEEMSIIPSIPFLAHIFVRDRVLSLASCSPVTCLKND